jgi:glucose-6-phosphate 1-dehydrogenase
MKTNISLNPTIVVIFGGTGDLNLRKLAPALYNLYADGYMPEQYSIIGTARKPLDDEKFRTALKEGVNSFSRSGKVKDDKWSSFSEHLHYTPVDVESPETFGTLKESIEKYQQEFGPKTQVNLLPGRSS